jgi:hypothetical protein
MNGVNCPLNWIMRRIARVTAMIGGAIWRRSPPSNNGDGWTRAPDEMAADIVYSDEKTVALLTDV